MTDDEKKDLAEAYDRLVKALAGHPDEGYSPAIRAGDVVLVGETIPEADHHPYTRDLLKGARNNPPEARIHQEVGKLRRLLAKVKLPK